MTQRNRLIKIIHVARRELRLADADYRALLEGATGKTSCTQLNLQQLDAVLAALKKQGFKHRLPADKQRKYSPQSGRARTAEADKIRAIWITMARQGAVNDGSEPGLNAWVARITRQINGGVGVANVGWLDEPLAGQVLEALKQWHGRVLADRLQAAGLQPERGYRARCQQYQWLTGQEGA